MVLPASPGRPADGVADSSEFPLNHLWIRFRAALSEGTQKCRCEAGRAPPTWRGTTWSAARKGGRMAASMYDSRPAARVPHAAPRGIAWIPVVAQILIWSGAARGARACGGAAPHGSRHGRMVDRRGPHHRPPRRIRLRGPARPHGPCPRTGPGCGHRPPGPLARHGRPLHPLARPHAHPADHLGLRGHLARERGEPDHHPRAALSGPSEGHCRVPASRGHRHRLRARRPPQADQRPGATSSSRRTSRSSSSSDTSSPTAPTSSATGSPSWPGTRCTSASPHCSPGTASSSPSAAEGATACASPRSAARRPAWCPSTSTGERLDELGAPGRPVLPLALPHPGPVVGRQPVLPLRPRPPPLPAHHREGRRHPQRRPRPTGPRHPRVGRRPLRRLHRGPPHHDQDPAPGRRRRHHPAAHTPGDPARRHHPHLLGPPPRTSRCAANSTPSPRPAAPASCYSVDEPAAHRPAAHGRGTAPVTCPT